MALQFKSLEGGAWKNLGTLPAIKKQMGLEKIEKANRGKGEFVLFVKKDGDYATTAYDSKNSPALKDAVLWEKPNGELLVGMAEYSRTELEVLDSL